MKPASALPGQDEGQGEAVRSSKAPTKGVPEPRSEAFPATGRWGLALNTKTVRSLAGLIAFALVGAWVLFRPADAARIWQGVVTVSTPFVLGAAAAFVVNLLLRPVERAWDRLLAGNGRSWPAKSKRPVGIFLSVVIIVGVMLVLLLIVIPELVRTLVLVAEALPDYGARVQSWWGWLADYLAPYGIHLPTLDLRLDNIRPMVVQGLTQWGPSFLARTFGFTTSVVTGVFNVVVGIVLALYILADKEWLLAQSRRVLRAFLPETQVRAVEEVAVLTDTTFSRFVAGQLTDAFIVGALCYVGVLLMRMPYPAAVAVLVGVTTIIPVIGVLLGTLLAALLILVVDPVKALWFIVFIVVLQQFESNVIYPKVVGQSVGLPGIWVLAAITVGGATFGVAGMLLGVPVFSVMYSLLRGAVHRRLAAK